MEFDYIFYFRGTGGTQTFIKMWLLKILVGPENQKKRQENISNNLSGKVFYSTEH
jgi:hypothetical protein